MDHPHRFIDFRNNHLRDRHTDIASPIDFIRLILVGEK